MEEIDVNVSELHQLPYAVTVRKAFKTYGRGSNSCPTLHNMNMTVKQGTIYSLLGASGCGKTTILQCILGLRQLDLGEIRVFGHSPGSKEACVPGRRVGYMPQDLGMYLDCSIEEMLVYFGLIHGMTRDQMKLQVAYLVRLLQLPRASRVIHTLSGGQQRRVSLAIALFHQAEFLVLDEPTVGLDPLLRQNIWKYMRQISSEMNTTVLFTTHYIDEARLADTVGMMRSGHLLEEDSPKNLLTKFMGSNMEEVFLKLCLKDEGMDVRDFRNTSNEVSDEQKSLQVRQNGNHVNETQAVCKPSSWSNHMDALLYKYRKRLFRMWKAMILFFFLPPAVMLMFATFIGNDPAKITIAVVNNELPSEPVCQNYDPCGHRNLSCGYLQALDHSIVNLVPHHNEASAVEAIRTGEAWGMLSFPYNYSENLIERLKKGRDADNDTLYNSISTIRMDMSNQQIGFTVQHMMLQRFLQFMKDLFSVCKAENLIGPTPVKFGDAIFGINQPNFQEFMAPGMFICIVFAISIGFSAGLLVLERKDGVLQRSFVAGINETKMFLAQTAVQYFIFGVQLAGMLVVMYFYQRFELSFSFIWFSILVSLQAGCGMCAGYVLSLIAEDIYILVPLVFTWVYPAIILSSTMWPLEGIAQHWLRRFCLAFPTTWATESSRSMLIRGWSPLKADVWPGYAITITWTGIFILITFVLLKVCKRKLMV